ncbi:hypothetical protein F5Y19DRAFT_443158 [Xylariaceae sp. FL1651]|nr:hypothetical protein F5Y19DRAFT_443158 [Xylariaceae sp. FL1651]
MKSTRASHIKSMRALFLTLRWRQAITCVLNFRPQRANYTLGLAHYYLPDPRVWFRYLRPEKRDSEIYLMLTFLSNLLEIEDLTATLLRNLESCRRVTAGVKSLKFQARLEELISEILYIILGYLRLLRNFSHAANISMLQSFWKNELILASDGLFALALGYRRRYGKVEVGRKLPWGR